MSSSGYRGLTFANPDEARLALPEKHLAARVRHDGAEVDVHNVHLPHGSGLGLLKVYGFEAIHKRLDQDAGRPRVLCGDFNAPGARTTTGH